MSKRYILGFLLLFTAPEIRAMLDSRGAGSGASPKAAGNEFQPIAQLPDSKPIVKPLKEGMRLCAENCDAIKNWGITGDAAHKARPSCHNSDEAIDIAAVRCNGQEMSPEQNADEFKKFVTCMGTEAKKQYERERYSGFFSGNFKYLNFKYLKDAILGDGFKVLYRKISGLLSGRSTCELMFCIRSLLFFFFQGI